MLKSLSVTAGTQGIALEIPDGVELLPVANPVEPGAALKVEAQHELIRAALTPLKQLAAGKRRVAVIVGDLSLPATYNVILPKLVKALVDTEVRPSRIGFLVHPGTGAPVLGRGAIHRYGEETVGDHELRSWAWDSHRPAANDPALESADLRIAVRPRLHGAPPLPDVKLDATLSLTLGSKLVTDVTAAELLTADPAPAAEFIRNVPKGDVYLTGGGGGEWEATLEEALLSLHHPVEAKTVVLAFSGVEGLGSARFANDVWNLLAEANEVLARDGALPRPEDGDLPEHASFDPAATVADALSRYERVLLFSPEFSQHHEGEDLAERLREMPKTGARLQMCGSQAALWRAVSEANGLRYTLYCEPLGWRSRTQGSGH
jgi:hypothetical protein